MIEFASGFLTAIFLVKIVLPTEAFYRGYFRQKQIDLGKDPDSVIREQFPILWWLFR